MSSEFKPSKLLRRSVLIGAALLMAGCQARPLYQDTNGETRGALAAIAYSEATSRIGLETRNRLIFLTSGGDETKTPEYRVELTVSGGVEGILLDETSDTANSGRAVVTGNYTLTRISDDTVLKTGRRSGIALFDYPRQEFAKLRAVRDAETRASRELAEVIYADLAMALGR
ncbi:LPS-assembly lipoprotein [Rhizobium sp. RU33A]|uniref:LPS assembly lipoprotein LptE n=1 Tax=Rhizobium sp. RU33A TaxID=1907413 RepID=UPI000953A848|nr:LPS assembly lipoprotein LptE [Rhizobium sp. RU33A]SIQ78955.1 LPS-assembly lipoprotein [Rhizobium sp. RU33A]